MEAQINLKKSEIIEQTKIQLIWYKMKKNPMTIIGLILILALAMIAILAPVISSYDPIKINIAERFKPPSVKHWFGTDEVGRDIFTRVIYGARLSLGTSTLIVLISGSIGLIIGAASGYFGGWTDQIIMRIMDMILAFPTLVLAMVLAATLGPNLVNAMLAISIVKIPVYVRLARGQTLSLRKELYVKAARTFGISSFYIIGRHIIPNIVTPVIIQITLDLGDTILLVATLGFLGLGARPPQPEWGTMISTGFKHMLEQWWYSTFPGLAVFLASGGFNLLGDGLRDILDPKSAR